MTQDFNERFNDQGMQPEYIFKPDNKKPYTYIVQQYRQPENVYVTVGSYQVVDKAEEPGITEKKLINLMCLMNEQKPLVDFKNLTNIRILYSIEPDTQENTKQKIIFRSYDGSGVSKENAVFLIEKGVFDEKS